MLSEPIPASPQVEEQANLRPRWTQLDARFVVLFGLAAIAVFSFGVI